jgi:hypothetical protein
VAAVGAEPRSKVTFDLEPLGETVKLKSISGGWPALLSNLKTLLETGEPLPADEGERPNSSR